MGSWQLQLQRTEPSNSYGYPVILLARKELNYWQKVKEENISGYVSFLQSKIDELATVAEAGGADKDKVAEIKGRLRLNFDEFVSATAMTNMH